MPNTWNPAKLSPVHHKLVNSGGAMALADGWLVAKDFGDAQAEVAAIRSRVGLVDLSPALKLELKGTGTGDYLDSLLGKPVPQPGRLALAPPGYVCRVSRNHAFFVFDREKSPLVAKIRQVRSDGSCLHAIDRTNGFGGFLLCGPQAAWLLNKLTSLDLRETSFPNFSCAFGPMAAIRALLAKRDRGGLPAYEIFFSREYGEYFWDAVREAGEEFRLQACGLDAARLLEHSQA